ncbi:MAG: ABC transporter permease [Acidobacteriota bacterium]
MKTIRQDLLYAMRMLAKHRAFTAIAALALALGIGANTTIFSFVNALLLRPLSGVSDYDRLVQVGRTIEGQDFDTLSYPNYLDCRDQSASFDGLEAYATTALHLSTGSEAERVGSALVTGNYFSTLGVKAARGRLLTPADEQAPGASPVAVISSRLWQRRFGGDPDIAGRAVSLNARSFTIVGVAADGFAGTRIGDALDIWVPITMYREVDPMFAESKEDFLKTRDISWLSAFGRLKEGVRLEQARAELSNISARLEEAHPDTNARTSVTAAPGLGIDPLNRQEISDFSLMLMGAVGFVLLIACANVANLLLAKATARQKEIGIKLALGATRFRIIRQLLVESLLLAMMGGVAGLFLALWLNDALAAFLPESYMGLPLAVDLSLDLRVLSFTFAASLVTGVIFGLAPAIQASKPDLVPLLKDSAATGRGAKNTRLRSSLVIAQVALSLVLMIGAGLLVKTLVNARAISPGFDTDRVLMARIDLARQNYTDEQGQIFYRRLIERVESLPGVEAASFALTVPLGGGSWGTGVRIEGQEVNSRAAPLDFNVVAPRYFATMGIPLVAGRDFLESDNARSPAVVIINETMAERLWPDQNPIGKRLAVNQGRQFSPWIEVVGVARDSKHRSPFEERRLLAYFPLYQKYHAEASLHVRAGGKPESLLSAVRQEVQAMDKNLPLFRVQTLSEQLDNALTPQRMAAAVISSFGLLAFALAIVGLYGVMSYTVAQRTREIGIRMALGANRNDVIRLIVRHGMMMSGIGIIIGVVGALGLTRILGSLLFGVSATDAATFAGIALALAVISIAACYLPARRAARVDPQVALRYE